MSDASLEGASENFRVLCTETAYDVIVFKFQGGGGGVGVPLRAPMVGRWRSRGGLDSVRIEN